MRQAVVACLALICVPVLAVVVHRHGENLAAYPCAAPVSRSFGAVAAQASPGKDPNCAARIPQNPWFPTDLPIFSDSPDQQFIQKAMEDVVVQEQVLALLPQTDGQYEQWARREYPHVMWFYDVLKAKGTYSGTWQHLLFVSGELLQFDYPLSLAQPNCHPNLGAITRAAAAAGFSFKPGDDGDVLLPALAWRDLLQTRRAALIAAPTVLPCVPPVMADPSDSLSRYAHMLVDDSKTAQKTLIYLFASSMLASEEIQDVRLKNNLASIASESCALLRQILFFPSKQQCVSDANADRLSHLLILRRALVSRALRASQEKAN
jgi:hypothetical protein